MAVSVHDYERGMIPLELIGVQEIGFDHDAGVHREGNIPVTVTKDTSVSEKSVQDEAGSNYTATNHSGAANAICCNTDGGRLDGCLLCLSQCRWNRLGGYSNRDKGKERAGYVDAKLANESLFGKQSYFKPEAAVTISFGHPVHEGIWRITGIRTGGHVRISDRDGIRLGVPSRWCGERPRTSTCICSRSAMTDAERICKDDSGLQAVVSPLILGHDSIKALAFSLSWGKEPYEVAEKASSDSLHALNREHRKGKAYPPLMEYIGFAPGMPSTMRFMRAEYWRRPRS